MISLVTGKIGSGKTLYCIGCIVAHLAKGGTVFTNIALDFDQLQKLIRKRYRRIIVSEQLVYVDLVESKKWHEAILWGDPELNVLVVWDEIHLFFNARDWAKTQGLHADMLSFLSQSRKACVDVMFIAQVAATLEKQFRVQCEWEFYCRNVKDISVPFFGTLPMNRMLLVQKDVETDKAMKRSLRPYDRGLFKVYDTRSFLDKQMREASKDRPRVKRLKLKRPPLVTLRTLGAAAVALVMVAFYLYSIR